MRIEVVVEGNKISVYRERPVNRQEKKRDKNARVMTEWVHIAFGEQPPHIVVNRNLCSR